MKATNWIITTESGDLRVASVVGQPKPAKGQLVFTLSDGTTKAFPLSGVSEWKKAGSHVSGDTKRAQLLGAVLDAEVAKDSIIDDIVICNTRSQAEAITERWPIVSDRLVAARAALARYDRHHTPEARAEYKARSAERKAKKSAAVAPEAPKPQPLKNGKKGKK